MFKKGMKVKKILHGAGTVSEEDGTVLSVNGDIVFLDNGGSNRPSGPYVKGLMLGVFGFWEEIVEDKSGKITSSSN